VINYDYKENKLLRIFLHVIFWIIIQYVISFIFIISVGRSINLLAIFELFLGTICLIPVTYLIIYFLIPKLVLKEKRYFLFIGIYIICLAFVTIMDPIIYTYIYIPVFKPAVLDQFLEYAYKGPFLLKLFYSKNIEISLFLSVKFLLEFRRGYLRKQQLKTEILNTELSILQSQLHPHFLFNTLNNIYSLIIDKCKNKVTHSVDKIINILDYTIHECNEPFIELEKEIKLIKDYIELEKLRYSSIDIKLEFPEEINQIKIIPLILFTFIENAFKHGTSNSIKNKWILARLTIQNSSLEFIVENSVPKSTPKDIFNYSQGVGLKNVKKRLSLLFEEDEYSLVTEVQREKYMAKLICKI